MPPPPADARLLVADIGGTHARLAWSNEQGGLALQVWARVADYPSLDALLGATVAGIEQARAMVLAVTGRVDDQGCAHSVNLPWTVDQSDLQARWHCPVRVINDFHALALACERLPADAGGALTPNTRMTGAGPLLVIGPGTGLGAAIVLPGHDGVPTVLPTEAGHIALAAHTPRQAAVVEQLRRQRGNAHVPVEAAVSGPGLLQLYRALCALDAILPAHDSPETVSAAAISGEDAQAREALDLFCHWLGSFCGDLALASGALRIWLAGGITAHIATYLADSGFSASLQAKGGMAPVLERACVRWVEHGALGLRGAALAAPLD